MSRASMRFITPLTFEAISSNTVLTSDSESWADDNNHIDICKWADIFVIAPATANTINKLSNGIADNLLTECALAYKGKKLLAPAANTAMYKNPVTQASLKMLQLVDFEILNPSNKLLVCGDEGEGALADVLDIFFKSAQILNRDSFWENRRVVVTGGGTIERIDDVRYISNFSSGKMAKAISTALYIKGADVCLIGVGDFNDIPTDIYKIDIESSDELKEYLVDAIRVAKKGKMTKATLVDDSVPTLVRKKPYLFMVAAVSDYRPKYPQNGKLKKSDIGDSWSLELEKNIDILSSIDKDEIYSVGFKAEIDQKSAKESAKEMLESKGLDAVALNLVSKYRFGSDKNRITLFTKGGEIELEEGIKLDLSLDLIETLSKIGE